MGILLITIIKAILGYGKGISFMIFLSVKVHEDIKNEPFQSYSKIRI